MSEEFDLSTPQTLPETLDAPREAEVSKLLEHTNIKREDVEGHGEPTAAPCFLCDDLGTPLGCANCGKARIDNEWPENELFVPETPVEKGRDAILMGRCPRCLDKGAHGRPCEICGIGHEFGGFPCPTCGVEQNVEPLSVQLPQPYGGTTALAAPISVENVIAALQLEQPQADIVRSKFNGFLGDMAKVLRNVDTIDDPEMAKAKRLQIRRFRLDVNRTTKAVVDATKPLIKAAKQLDKDISEPCEAAESKLFEIEDAPAKIEREKAAPEVHRIRSIIEERAYLLSDYVRNVGIYNLDPGVMSDEDFAELLANVKRVHETQAPAVVEAIKDVADDLNKLQLSPEPVLAPDDPEYHRYNPKPYNKSAEVQHIEPVDPNSATDMEEDAKNLQLYFRAIQVFSGSHKPAFRTEWGKHEFDSFYDALANFINDRARRIR